MHIEIVSKEPIKDAEGFVTSEYSVLARVKAYFEQKNSTEKWVNMAQNNNVNALFRLRYIPGLQVTTEHFIFCNDRCYDIYSVEDVKNKHMYLEILASEQHNGGMVRDG